MGFRVGLHIVGSLSLSLSRITIISLKGSLNRRGVNADEDGRIVALQRFLSSEVFIYLSWIDVCK